MTRPSRPLSAAVTAPPTAAFSARVTRLPALCLAALLALGMPQGAALAQGSPYAAALYVNDRAISNYEIDQRARFMALLRAPGDPRTEAEKGLIEDRLRLDAAKQAGIRVAPDQIKNGMTEFASRANLTAEQFVQALGQGGVEAATFRDFVEAGIAWREVVRAKYGEKLTVSDADIDRELSVTENRGAGPRILVSEIILPMTGKYGHLATRRARELSEGGLSQAEFAGFARKYSSAPSRDAGGQIGWIPLTNLPMEVRGALMQMRPGEITQPVRVPEGIAIFQLRGLKEGSDKIDPGQITVDYAEFLIPGGNSAEARAEAARILGRADSCNALYTAARGLPANQLQRKSQPLRSVPRDVATELAKLDENEASTAIVRGNALVLLMLCKRTATEALDSPAAKGAPDPQAPRINEDAGFAKGPSRDAVRAELLNRKISDAADAYLAELQADALIRRP